MSELHELAGLYVVDALTPAETREFETHLSGCAACQEEVEQMRSVTDQLSRSVAADPPAALRSRVLAEISSLPQEPRQPEDPLQPQDSVQPQEPAQTHRTPAPESREATVVSLSARRSSRLPYLVAAASVLLALGFGGWALQSREDARQAGEQQSEIIQVVGAPDVQAVSATTPDGGAGTVVLSQSQDQAIFVANGMATLPAGKVYELWTIEDAPVPAGTFTPNGSPSVVSLPDAALSAHTIAVTVEPAGGSDQPTTDPVMTLPLT